MEHSNLSTTCFLVNQDVRAIAVTYEKIDVSQDTRDQKFKAPYLSAGRLPEGAEIFKTFDLNIKVDDYVVIPTGTRHGMTVCKVVAVDVELDFNTREEIQWIVDTVDVDLFEKSRQWEDQMLASVKNARVTDQREKLADQLKKSVGGNLTALPAFENSADETEEGRE